MAQVKIYARQSTITAKRALISEAIHSALVQALSYPPEKKFQRFIGLAAEDFIYPEDRSEQYMIIEISLFEGRSVESKKQLIRLLYTLLEAQAEINPQDVEITLFETPKHNWGIRGLPGDELTLNYKIEV